jgi:hypothetical protein
MSYVVVTLVLATLFGLDAYETALAIFIAAFLIYLCRARAARERAKRNGSLLCENFRKLPPSRSFKKPLKPPLLLFDFSARGEHVQRSSVLARHLDPTSSVAWSRSINA